MFGRIKVTTLSAPTTTQTTHLTINCISDCTFLGDTALTCSTVIKYQGNLLWPTQTTSTNNKQTLNTDVQSGPVVLKAGAVIVQNMVGNMLIVTFTGVIVDSGSDNTLQGRQIGVFPITAS